jgi:hypothetical protein
MTIKEIRFSDIGGAQLDDSKAARLVVSDHPSLGGRTVELDVEVSEAEQLEMGKLTMVSVAIYLPGESSPRRVILDASVFDGIFPASVDVDEVLRGARLGGAAEPSKRRGRPRGAAAAPKRAGAKLDYSSPELAGQLHRGRLTEAEAAWVRDNRDLASKNRVAQGHPPIDWSAPKERQRYGL